MTAAIDALQVAATGLDGWEVAAVALAIAYLLLAVRQSLWCWAAALASTAIYLVLFLDAGLYMESALQLFYAAMAVYGWSAWRSGGLRGSGLTVSTWPFRRHLFAVGTVLVLSAASGWALSAFTEARFPYVDSFTTWASVVTTWMVARKILENWGYWFVIDSVSIWLYVQRSLYLTAALFALYLVIVVFGYRDWHRDWAARRRTAWT